MALQGYFLFFALKDKDALGKGTELRWQRRPKTQIFAENRRFSQIHPFFRVTWVATPFL